MQQGFEEALQLANSVDGITDIGTALGRYGVWIYVITLPFNHHVTNSITLSTENDLWYA